MQQWAILWLWTLSPLTDSFYCLPSRSCQAVPSLFGASLEVAHPRSVRSISVISELGPWPAEPLRASPSPRTPPMRWAALSHCARLFVYLFMFVCVCLAKAEQGPAKKALQHKTVTFQFGWVNAVVRRTWLCCPHFHRASSCTTIYIWISIQSMPDYINDDVA